MRRATHNPIIDILIYEIYTLIHKYFSHVIRALNIDSGYVSQFIKSECELQCGSPSV